MLILRKFMESSAKQYGFVNGRSTTTQLLSCIGKCIGAIATEKVVDTIYCNFARAFNNYPHQRLLGKPQSFGVNRKILNLIKALSSNRYQIVKVNGIKSVPATVLSAILQGSVLRSIHFWHIHK